MDTGRQEFGKPYPIPPHTQGGEPHPDPPRLQGGKWIFVLIFVLNLWGLRFIFVPENMDRGFENLDTRVIASRLQEPYHPLQWFTGDWALGNGFYRPLPTLSFALDVKLWGLNYNLYKIQNWLIAVVCSFLVVWFVWELLRSTYFALGSGVLFAGWQSGVIDLIPWELLGWAGLVLISLYGLIKGRTPVWKWGLLASVVLVIGYEVSFPLFVRDLHEASFSYRAMGWPPGRTSTLMTLFALISFASYCRFERLRSIGWGGLALVGLLAAFCCHEQSITLPFLMMVCAVFLRIQGVCVQWHYLMVPFLLLGAYLSFHTHYIPADTEYRHRRTRGIHPACDALISWFFPVWHDLVYLIGWIRDTELELLIFTPVTLSFWISSLRTMAYSTIFFHLRKDGRIPLLGLLGSTIVYAPLAFVLPLQHYYYLPLVIRTIFVLAVVRMLFRFADFESKDGGMRKGENCGKGS